MAAAVQMTDQQFGDPLDSIRPNTAAMKTVSRKDLPSFCGTLLEKIVKNFLKVRKLRESISLENR